MSTNNTENLGFKIVTMGREDFDNRPPCNLNPITLAKLHAWIDAKQIDANLKIELKKSASSYPQQALARWQKTYNKQLSIIQKKIKNKTLEENVKSLDVFDINDLDVKRIVDDVQIQDDLDVKKNVDDVQIQDDLDVKKITDDVKEDINEDFLYN